MSGEIILSNFSYAALQPNDQAVLRDAAAFINEAQALIKNLRFEIGFKLLEIKDLYPGEFMAWCATELNFSYDTVGNYMNAALRWGDCPLEIGREITRSAIYTLTTGNVAGSARENAILLAQGERKIRIDDKVAYVLAHAPIQVEGWYTSGQIDKDAAFELARAYRNLPDDVREYCLQHEVKDAGVVLALRAVYFHESSLEYGSPPPIWRALADDEDGRVGGFGWDTSVSEARPIDIQRYGVDFEARAIDETRSYKWDWQTAILHTREVDGRAILDITSYVKPGTQVMVKIRVPVKG